MAKKSKVSVLRSIVNDIYVSKSFEEALATVFKHLDDPEVSIHDNERFLIKRKAELCGSLLALQKYITNSFLKYENMSVR
jgi:hypothetical protein